MKRGMRSWVTLALLLFIFVYVFLLLLVVYKYSSIDATLKNKATRSNMTLVVPKQVTIGRETTIELIYIPQLNFKYKPEKITLIDNSGAYDIKTPIVLYKKNNGKLEYPITFGLTPYYSKFTYVIPAQVCPQKIVYTSCKEIPTKKGRGMIRLTYEPEVKFDIFGEGYQGDGEHLQVPVEVK